MNVQVIADPDGTVPRTSGAMPGRTHDLTAARVWGILREPDKTGIITLADKGYQGAEACVVTTRLPLMSRLGRYADPSDS